MKLSLNRNSSFQKGKKASLKFLTCLTIGLLTIPSLGMAQSQETQQSQQTKTGFAIYPTNPTVIDYQNIVVEAKPGDTVKDSITVESFESSEESFDLYPTESTKDKNGTLVFKQKADVQNDIGLWTKLGAEKVTLQPNEKKMVDVTITVPADAKMGDYDEAIAIEHFRPSTKYPGILISRRVIMHVKLKVTDTPQVMRRALEANIFNSTTPYFWISIGIFTASMAYFIYAQKREKNAKLKESKKQ